MRAPAPVVVVTLYSQRSTTTSTTTTTTTSKPDIHNNVVCWCAVQQRCVGGTDTERQFGKLPLLLRLRRKRGARAATPGPGVPADGSPAAVRSGSRLLVRGLLLPEQPDAFVDEPVHVPPAKHQLCVGDRPLCVAAVERVAVLRVVGEETRVVHGRLDDGSNVFYDANDALLSLFQRNALPTATTFPPVGQTGRPRRAARDRDRDRGPRVAHQRGRREAPPRLRPADLVRGVPRAPGAPGGGEEPLRHVLRAALLPVAAERTQPRVPETA